MLRKSQHTGARGRILIVLRPISLTVLNMLWLMASLRPGEVLIRVFLSDRICVEYVFICI